MPVCPVCDKDVHADEVAFEHHVNAHFDEGGHDPQQSDDHGFEILGDSPPVEPKGSTCFICGISLGPFTELEKNAHVSSCMDNDEQMEIEERSHQKDQHDRSDDGDYDHSSDDGGHAKMYGRKARRTADGLWNGATFAGHREKTGGRANGDKWWDPVRGDLSSGLPLNFSPGLIPVLKDLLLRSVEQGHTRRAVLARSAVHIKGSFGFDGVSMGWGCGYRNAEMAIASLLLLPNSPYASVFKEKGDPGVRAIQQWIDEAWRAGFDPEGRTQFKGKIVGTSKWIGPTDLYAMFSCMGIPCTIYDFPKPEHREGKFKGSAEPSYSILLRWVKNYFDADEPQHEPSDALDELMHVAPAVRISSRLPLMLQVGRDVAPSIPYPLHNGHSRTIVGYETDLRGEITLLLMDPGKTVPKDVRDAGLKHAEEERAGTRSVTAPQEDVPVRVTQVEIREDIDAAQPTSGDEVGPGGWVRRKVPIVKTKGKGKALGSSLSSFRMKPKREQKEFQVLAFPGTDLLTLEERLARRPMSSVQVNPTNV